MKMSTFKAYFKKEVLESLRQYRYLVLIIGIFFFAILDPIMYKLLPDILKSQLSSDKNTLNALSALFNPSVKVILQNFNKDLFQIGNLVVVFTLCGTFSEEISTKKFVFPYAKGAFPWEITLAKLIHYTIVISLIVICGYLLDYYYANLLFKGGTVKLYRVFVASFLICIYYIFNIILTMFFSSIAKKGIISGIVVLGISYLSALLNGIKQISIFSPYNLVATASGFKATNINETIAVVIIYCIILVIATMLRMEKAQVV